MKKGFTLLELMVIIGIIGIMTGVGLVSLSPAKKHYALKSAQDEVTAAIKLAQSYALQGKMPSSGDIACAYGFYLVNDSTYQIFYYKKNTTDGSCGTTENKVEENTLKNAVTAHSPQSRVYFMIPSGQMNLNYSVYFDYAGVNTTSNVIVDSGGLVTEN
ncbi:MAG: prepilin-type N-terminal cleavage/methylation domain-containing protein [bacterium]|nr:prepilin-type N-terminal cleavage/methylation domain-containing protein [bacterium]